MKKLFSVIIFLSFFCNDNFAQHIQFEWQNCFSGPLPDVVYDITPTGDGYLIVGYYSTYTNPAPDYINDVWVIKIDLEGNYQWDKKLGGTLGDAGFKIITAQNGNYYILANSVSYNGDISNDPYFDSLDFWILKIDGSGNIIWERIVGGNAGDYLVTGTPTSDGGLVAIGYTSSNDGEVSIYYGAYDMWLIKMNSSGEKVWDFSIGTTGFDFGTSIIETSDGGFLVGGTSRLEEGGNIDCSPFSDFAESILFKLDSNGNIEWQKCYGGSGDEGVFDLIETRDGYLMGCFGQSADGDLTGSGYHVGYNHLGQLTDDTWLVKLDFFGNIIWQKCYGGTKEEALRKMFQTQDGGFMLFGNTQSLDGDVVGNHSNPGNYDVWMFKIDSVGTMQWQRCIGSLGTEKIEFAVSQISDVTYVIGANAQQGIDGDLSCIPPDPYDLGIWAFEITDTTTVSITESKQLLQLNLYPNPATTWLSVEIPPTISFQQTLLQIIDINGKTVLTQKPVSTTTHLNIRHLPAGIYVLKMINDEALVAKRFLIR
jgi:hypothetical protein